MKKMIVVCLMLGVPLFFATGCVSSGDDASDAVSSYSVGVTVAGLVGSGLTLQNNGGDELPIDSDGSYTLAADVSDGETYNVTVATQPSLPDQFCNVYYHSGTINGADATDIDIQCVTGRFNVVDTGQITCYDSTTGDPVTCVGIGYDADYEGNPPDYRVSADSTMVTDNVTGLIWTQTPDTDGNGVVNAADKMTLEEAEAYCSRLSFGGFEWRLPTIKELYSLILFSGEDPSGYTGSDISVLTPFIDDNVFEPGFGDTSAGERIIDGQYATSTVYTSPLGTINGADTMFGVNFIDGRIKGYPYDYPPTNPKTFYVLAVAGGNPDYGQNDFMDNGDQTISDLATGLMWQQDDYASVNFEDAIAYCEASTTGGWTDWRLPDVKELQSIVDYSRAPDTTGSAAIDPVFNATAITSEDGKTDWGYYWASTTHTSYGGHGTSGTYVSFGRALGYFDSALTDVHGAGAQRSNHKSDNTSDGTATALNLGYGTFYYKGPQGDILRIDNMVRCVRRF
jgi:hypothetical protein